MGCVCCVVSYKEVAWVWSRLSWDMKYEMFCDEIEKSWSEIWLTTANCNHLYHQLAEITVYFSVQLTCLYEYFVLINTCEFDEENVKKKLYKGRIQE